MHGTIGKSNKAYLAMAVDVAFAHGFEKEDFIGIFIGSSF